MGGKGKEFLLDVSKMMVVVSKSVTRGALKKLWKRYGASNRTNSPLAAIPVNHSPNRTTHCEIFILGLVRVSVVFIPNCGDTGFKFKVSFEAIRAALQAQLLLRKPFHVHDVVRAPPFRGKRGEHTTYIQMYQYIYLINAKPDDRNSAKRYQI